MISRPTKRNRRKSVVTDANRLPHVRPDLVAGWHPTKNKPLFPKDVSFGSGQTVWWKCSKHKIAFGQRIIERSRGRLGCRLCVSERRGDARSKPKAGESFAERFPNLAVEWHPTKNSPRTPSNVKHGSGFQAWWICSECHAEYKIQVAMRKQHGCPKCGIAKRGIARSIPKKGKSLADLHPDVANVWHPTKNGNLLPSAVRIFSNKKVWWQCRRGHEWEASVTNRTKGRGCPYCTTKISRLQLRLYTELMYLFPDAKLRHHIEGIECDVFLPSLSAAIEVDGFYWHKKQARKDRAKNQQLQKRKIKTIRVRQPGLPKIGRHDVLQHPNETELKICQRTVKAIQASNLIHRKDLHDVERYLASTKLQNDALFLKLNNILPNPLPGTSLAELKPAIAQEWHPSRNGILTPADVTLRSNLKCWWKCVKGEDHEWQTSINERSSGRGCPFCAGRRVSKANNLMAMNPQLAAEWHTGKNKMLTPNDVTAFSHRRVWWQCPSNKEHIYDMPVSERSNGHGCCFCAGRRVHKSNSLATKYPSLVKWWHQSRNGLLTPFNVLPNSRKRVWWVCSKGHKFQRYIGDRIRAKHCPICTRKELHPSNCLAKVRPDLAREWLFAKNGNLTPKDLVPGSAQIVWWKCKKCDHEWRASLNNRSQGRECPVCAYKKRWQTRKQRFGSSGRSNN